jgi:hypothetical protein
MITMKRIAFLMMVLLLVTMSALADSTAPPPHPAVVTPDPWPKSVDFSGAKYTIYQPQLDRWDNYNFAAHAAVSVQPAGATEPRFGVIHLSATTWIDRTSRTVYFNNISVANATFPANPEQAATYQTGFQSMMANGPSSMSLDRLEAALAILGAEKTARQVPVKNEPPRLIFSQNPALLVTIDGEPAWRQVAGTTFERAINSRALILWDSVTGALYLHLYDGFVTAPSIAGPWSVTATVPPEIAGIARQLGTDRVVDLMTGQPDPDTNKLPSLTTGAPQVFVATSPTELIITTGAPDWVPITGTMLLYVGNTTANIFKNLNDQQTYLLVTGRWFRAPGFNGPWQYVPASTLPPDFASIPDDSPKENVKASIPGTPQSKEALIAAQIPQSATVDRAKLTFTPTITGQPEMKPIPDTALMYVANSPDPVIMVAPDQWYSVRNGVWFTGPSLQGPWSVATSVPAAIYAIPPSSPLYYVTYVKIYSVTPQYVVVGYTPGYMGTVVTSDGMVVYGTGYTYMPYIGATVWYPPPITYGYAANVTYTPWTGWAVGFGIGWGVGAAWGAPAPYWGAYGAAYGYHGYGTVVGPHGAAVWGPGGWAATSGNVYRHWGNTGAVTHSAAGYNAWTGNAWSNKVGMSYNSTTGRISAGQKASVSNVYNGNYASGERGATYNPSTGVSAKGGTVTTGNAYTGKQNDASWGKVTGPGGQSASAVKVNNNYYGDHDGNVYKYNSTTGTAEKYNGSGSWSNVDKPTTQSLQSQAAARSAGDSKSAASSWGSSGWGGGFDKSAASSAPKSTGDGGGWGGAEKSSGGGGWDRSSGGSGGWDRGGDGFGGSGGHSWGGGGFGGGGFRGGGRR